MSEKKTAVIIGAGPAGISCAYELAKRGIEVQVFEAGSHVGGMAKSFDLWGQRVDMGPHRFFTKNDRVNNFFFEIIKQDYTLVTRRTRIYYRNRFFNYPLRLFNVLGNLDIITVARIMMDYFYRKMFPVKNPSTFEEWVTNRFGKKLFEIFFKNYSEKLWGIPCAKIDVNWAAQRIKSFSLWSAVSGALAGNKNNKHKTLVGKFTYPNLGTGTLYEKASELIKKNGGTIHLDTPVDSVLIDESNHAYGVKLLNGTIVHADSIVSSMPLTLLVKRFNHVPLFVAEACDKLYFRNTILVYLEIDSENLFSDNWIYIHSPEVKNGRITNFRNWSAGLNGDKKNTILCMEYWAFDKDRMWTASDQELCQLAKTEIRLLNLIPKENNIMNTHVARIPKCYPVYEKGYLDHLKIIEKFLDGISNLLPIGRYGSFKYNNQDHSILMGLLAADKITDKTSIDLWSVNTDTEYQEIKK